LVLSLFVVALVFLVFTVAMGCEQLEAIESGKGKIARMKQRVGASGATEYARVTEEFNEMFGGTSPHPAWHWLVPAAPVFPRGMKTVVLGYVRSSRKKDLAAGRPLLFSLESFAKSATASSLPFCRNGTTASDRNRIARMTRSIELLPAPLIKSRPISSPVSTRIRRHRPNRMDCYVHRGNNPNEMDCCEGGTHHRTHPTTAVSRIEDDRIVDNEKVNYHQTILLRVSRWSKEPRRV
jgi:hypothetical protein